MVGDRNDYMISFVIPSYNEQEHIENTISAILLLLKGMEHEIIVVDNGSTDETVHIVKRFNVELLIDHSKTIAGLRNLGAKNTKGDIIAFLDADVIVTEKWVEEMKNSAKRITDMNKPIITGARCGVKENPGWIEKNWFLPMMNEKAKYINSGNLIISRELFFQTGGFSEQLETAEDYEFCIRARETGITIENNKGFYVIHEGYPRTLKDFVKREMWHGTQDAKSLKSIVSSQVAAASMIYLLTPFLGIVITLVSGSFIYIILSILISMLIALIATLKKRANFTLSISAYFIMYNVYFFSRGLALIKKLID